VGLGGVDLLETSIGHGWQQGPRNSPTVLNAVFNVAQFVWAPARNKQSRARQQAGRPTSPPPVFIPRAGWRLV
jgi:cytochrome c peroxidase